MDLSPVTVTQTPADEKQWLGSKHGTDCPRTITLDLSDANFAAVTVTDPLVATRKYIKGGVPVYDPGNGLFKVATGGTHAAAGHLLEPVQFNTGSVKAGAALLWHGVVKKAKVPGTFVAGDQATANILYV